MGNRSHIAIRIILLVVNVSAIVIGLVYLFSPSLWTMGHIFGVLLILATVLDSVVCAFEERRRVFSVIYLYFTIAAFILLPFNLLMRASLVISYVGFALVGYALVFGSLSLGCMVSLGLGSNGRGETGAGPEAATGVLSAGIVALGCAIRFILSSHPNPRTAGVLVPQCLPYWSLSFLALAALTVRFFRATSRSGGQASVAAIPALAAALVSMIPLFQTPGVIKAADRSFRERFGVEASSVQAPGIYPEPFSLGEMFLGSFARAYSVELDIPYTTETVADGRSYTFTFDHWSPVTPGLHPVLIRIHGGAWISGDKGYGNIGAVDRRFASLGYEVFDLNYGLNETATYGVRSPTPKSVLGPFSIDDMVRQIGTFSTYLVDHAQELGADIDRVFVSGGSAGGHLTLAVSLARTSGYILKRPGYGIDPRITIRGIIPLYAAVGYAATVGVPSDPVLDDPTPILGPGDPPALFYHGVLDGMIHVGIIRTFVKAYNKADGGRAVLIEFPSAGHGSDLVHWGCYSQVFLYYEERFLVLESR